MVIVSVDCEHIENNPKCSHGPTLKFSRLCKGRKEEFYACSAFRSRKHCPFYLPVGERLSDSKKLAIEQWTETNIPKIDHAKLQERFKKIRVLTEGKRKYCLTCHSFFFEKELHLHSSHHIFPKRINDYMLYHPLKILNSLEDNKKEAQFWFSKKTCDAIITGIKSSYIDNILCFGTPSIHAAAQDNKMNTVLLDIDYRFHSFYNSIEFCWFNMFNLHFFGNETQSRLAVTRILKSKSVGIVIDPPFGARIEPLKKSIDSLTVWHNNECSEATPLKVFLILPYFMEKQIITSFCDFKPIPYEVQYVNHPKFRTRSNGNPSPVIIFTNSDRSLFRLPEYEGYKFCDECKAWVSSKNKHCSFCNNCTSLSGLTYKHCNKCTKCVKESWFHCQNCDFCVNSHHICDKGREPTHTYNRYKRKNFSSNQGTKEKRKLLPNKSAVE